MRQVLASGAAAEDNGSVAHILPDPPRPWPPAGPTPRPKRNRNAAPGWTCPSCGHSYAPWVPECRHCPEPPAFIAKENDPGPIEMGRP